VKRSEVAGSSRASVGAARLGWRSGRCFSTRVRRVADHRQWDQPARPGRSDRNAPASISARCMEAPGSGKNFPRHDFAGCTVPRRRRLFAADRGRAPRMPARFHRRRLAVTAHCGRMISAAEPRPRSPCTASRDRRGRVYSCEHRLQSKSSRNPRAILRSLANVPAILQRARRAATCRMERHRDRAVRS